ncbi:hypothetical protein B0H19DRAFT_1328687 [Mycena capillaripes]|nr:hypothetical protein B0H19DRAFT_1328687 [Mycena capillaripes]
MPTSSRSAQPAQPSSLYLPLDKNPDANAAWTDADVLAFLDFLVSKISAAGEGGNFKMTTFNAAKDVMNKIRTRGGLKTAKSCHGKYKAVIDALRNNTGTSGFTWTDEHGANIDAATAAAWDGYVKVYPDAKPFRNHGWPFLSRMDELVPSQAKGTHVFRASQAVVLGDEFPGSLSLGDEDQVGSPTRWNMEDENYGKDDELDDDEQGSSSSPTPAAQTPAPAGRKRPASPTSTAKKRVRRSGGSAALGDIAASAGEFIEILGNIATTFSLSAATAAAPPPPATPVPATAPATPVQATGALEDMIFQPTPRRKHAAMLRAQQLETYLLPSELGVLIKILSSSKDKADTYNAILPEQDALREWWVRDEIRQHNLQNGLNFDFM